MVSLKKSIAGGIAALAVTATLFAGAAPAQAHDGRNAALIGGLVVGALIGGALASDAQAYEPAPVYRSQYHYQPRYQYRSHYRDAAYDGYGDEGYRYVPAHRYRNCDHGYRRASDWDDED
ncbi:MAG: hypothetical protein E6614_17690 [Bradyrhizobium sp.]|uniref:Uncharacterized protein n=1 Tax=Bradyrhizobium denitrificans TaxID=2734912 RepID=A0ABS5G8L9_9BRAD|nr:MULTISPECIES: hypothetical protein [Bradyrhizobium]MDU7186218.1 hypothetical protein [Klebsiella sp.]RTL98851.1 MAG: hypothetical protein EKK32_18295 [Bradyrhizobiaceae bacterium]ABQ38977.1 putative exported protein of unknown function [Bradyrhizobium sp. BTAi1]MBR1137667.1 hypothetical protein [Bradyrhizobium denitrificans]MCL8482296.1 hypothetical protein [Bradyrhizobium denitrificans]